MGANFDDLPTELWLHISRYLTSFQLCNLKSVNVFFLNRWMDVKWKTVDVEISARYSKTVLRLLDRMLDPFVAVSVKRLSISLHSKRLGTPKASRMTFNTTLKVLHLLPNIASLNITLIDYAAFYVTVFFQTIISTGLARALKKLEFKRYVDLYAYASLWESTQAPFENLTELALELGLDNNPNAPLSFEPFFRSLAPTLQTLRIRIDPLGLDLSSFLNTLLSRSDTPVLFPRLDSLTVCVAFNKSFRSFPQSLRSFLLTHKNLQHVHLEHLNYMEELDTETYFGDMLVDVLNSESQYPSLQSLAISPSTSQAGLSAVMALIRRNARTLSSLSILERFLSFEEAKQVVDALTEIPMATKLPAGNEPLKLRSLSMNITRLSVSFLDLLAHKIPQLEKLSLSVDEIVGSDQGSFYDLLRHRRYNPNFPCTQDVLHTWKLHTLEILVDWGNRKEAVRAVADVVPALSRRMEDDDSDYDSDPDY